MYSCVKLRLKPSNDNVKVANTMENFKRQQHQQRRKSEKELKRSCEKTLSFLLWGQRNVLPWKWSSLHLPFVFFFSVISFYYFSGHHHRRRHFLDNKQCGWRYKTKVLWKFAYWGAAQNYAINFKTYAWDLENGKTLLFEFIRKVKTDLACNCGLERARDKTGRGDNLGEL